MNRQCHTFAGKYKLLRCTEIFIKEIRPIFDIPRLKRLRELLMSKLLSNHWSYRKEIQTYIKSKKTLKSRSDKLKREMLTTLF